MPVSPTNPPVDISLRPLNIGIPFPAASGHTTAGSSTALLYISLLIPGGVSATGLKITLNTGGNGNALAAIYDFNGNLLASSASTATTSVSTTNTTQAIPFSGGAVFIAGPKHVYACVSLSSGSDTVQTLPAAADAATGVQSGSVTITANTLPATLTPSATLFTSNVGPILAIY